MVRQKKEKEKNLCTVAVVSKLVNTAGARASDNVLGGERLDTLTESSRGTGTLERDEVSSETSDVRASHGSSGDGVGSAVTADPGRLDQDTRSEDVEGGTEVGEAGAGISAAGGADGESGGFGGGGEVVGVGVVVAGCDDGEDSGGDGLGDGVVGCGAADSTERHGDDGAGDTVVALGVAHGPAHEC